MFKLKKNSQVTIFIFLGFLLIILLLIFNNLMIKNEYNKINENFNFELEVQNFEEYLEQCLKYSTEKTVERYGLNYLNQQLEYYIKKNVLDCLENYNKIKHNGVEIRYSFIELELSFNEISYYNSQDTVIEVKSNLYSDIIIKIENNQAKVKNKEVKLIYPKDFNPLEGFNPIYRGIFYKFENKNELRPLNIFIIKVDLYDPTLKFYVTPRIAPNVMKTSEFLEKNNLQLAINGGGFDIGNTNEVNGYAVYNGVPYSNPELVPDVTLFVSENNEIFMMPNMPNNIKYAISGLNHIIEDGKIKDRFYKGNPQYKEGYDYLHPRTSIGLDENNKWLNIIIIDGRNPGISEGVSALELGEIHLKYGSTNMINMDGGGSTTLVINEKGVPKILNTPSDGTERPVANHFGIWAEDLSIYK